MLFHFSFLSFSLLFSSYIYLFHFIFFSLIIIIIVIIIFIYIFVHFGWLKFFFHIALFLCLSFESYDRWHCYIYLSFFYVCLHERVWVCTILPSHKHCVHDMSEALYLGLSNFRIRGDCVAVPRWMYFTSGHCENPS